MKVAHYFRAPPNNSFNWSANSVASIVNLSVMALCARPVNSGVRPLSVIYRGIDETPLAV
jgi:hypothetical protein